MKIVALVIIIWFIFLSSLTVTISNKKAGIKYTFQWNGVVWVFLDYYSILMYESTDTPMELFTYKKEKLL